MQLRSTTDEIKKLSDELMEESSVTLAKEIIEELNQIEQIANGHYLEIKNYCNSIHEPFSEKIRVNRNILKTHLNRVFPFLLKLRSEIRELGDFVIDRNFIKIRNIEKEIQKLEPLFSELQDLLSQFQCVQNLLEQEGIRLVKRVTPYFSQNQFIMFNPEKPEPEKQSNTVYNNPGQKW